MPPVRIAAFLVLVWIALASCASDPDDVRPERSSRDSELPRPEVPPAPEFDELERRAPLRYPQLLDDPEAAAGADAEIAGGRAPLETEAGSSGDLTADREGAAGRAGSPPRLRLPTDPQLEDLLASLSLRRRIGQRFIAAIQGSSITYGAGRAIIEASPAGFIVYPWNFGSAADVRRLSASLQNLAESVTPGIRLILCADQEGGRVATFRFPEFLRLPAAHHMAKLGAGPVEAGAYLTALQMRALGLNMNLAPVLDVYGSPDDSIIGDRSYSGDPETVASLVEPYLRGSRAGGVISVAKHFPGHGITTVDSHAELPVVSTTLNELRARDLLPFGTAISAGVEVIMTAHILFESIDPFYPVTLSRVFLTSILRRELGFTGVVMSDGLEMGAIRNNYDLNESLIRMFKNDVDLILLFAGYDVIDVVDRVVELVRLGEISEDDVDRGVRRVLALKLRNGLADPGEL